MKRTIAAKELVTSSGLLLDPLVTLDDGRILKISTRRSEPIAQGDHDFRDCTLTPGFLDIHFHETAGYDVMEAGPEALETVARHLSHTGVTRFLPTRVTASLEATSYALERIANYIEAEPSTETARAAGIDIGDPFLSHAKRGMRPAEFLLQPSPELLNRFREISRGHLRMMTIAPEVLELAGSIRNALHSLSRT